MRKYANDPTYNRLAAAVEAKSWKDAFLAAHTLKGICQNLGMDNLYRSAFEVTEALRGGSNNTNEEMLDRLKADYEAAVETIKQLS